MSTRRSDVTESNNQVDILAKRLDDGWKRIEDAQRRGQDVMDWNDFWIDLLRQYEEAAPRDYDEWVPL